MHRVVYQDTQTVHDDLTEHLKLLHTEAAQTVTDMEAINATSAAAAYYRMQRTCERFLSTPSTTD